ERHRVGVKIEDLAEAALHDRIRLQWPTTRDTSRKTCNDCLGVHDLDMQRLEQKTHFLTHFALAEMPNLDWQADAVQVPQQRNKHPSAHEITWAPSANDDSASVKAASRILGWRAKSFFYRLLQRFRHCLHSTVFAGCQTNVTFSPPSTIVKFPH